MIKYSDDWKDLELTHTNFSMMYKNFINEIIFVQNSMYIILKREDINKYLKSERDSGNSSFFFYTSHQLRRGLGYMRERTLVEVR